MKIALVLDGLELGYLEERNSKYLFMANSSIIQKLRDDNNAIMKLFNLNDGGVSIFEDIPFPYNSFLMYGKRLDIKGKAGILDSDSDFQKLYKLAFLKMVTENFEIRQA